MLGSIKLKRRDKGRAKGRKLKRRRQYK